MKEGDSPRGWRPDPPIIDLAPGGLSFGAKRVTVDLSGELYKRAKLLTIDQGITLKALFLGGLNSMIKPDFRFETTKDSLVIFLQDVREIHMAGATLPFLSEEQIQGFLIQELRERNVPMSFVIADPEHTKEAAMAVLGQRYRSEGRNFEKELRRMRESLRTFQELGAEKGGLVKIRAIRSLDLEIHDLIITEQAQPPFKIRFLPFLLPGHREEALEVDADSQEGRRVCDLFRHYYTNLLANSVPINLL